MPKAANTTRRLLPKTAHMLAFDLREEARRLAPQALDVVAKALHSKDERTRLVAATIILERGYGKPLVQVEAQTVHRFAQVPAVMSKADWLATRGDPKLIEGKPLLPDAPTTLDRKPADDDSKLN
jgi:acyl carrier protein phosphodiesterase